MTLFHLALIFLLLYALLMVTKHHFDLSTNKLVMYGHVLIGTLYIASFIVLTASLLKITYLLVVAGSMSLLGLWISYDALKHLRTQLFKPENHMVRDGIYSHLRHPLYLSMLLFAYSAILATLSMELVVYAFLITLCYAIIIPVEERELVRRFGKSYETYKNRVPALIPRLKHG